MLYHDKMNRVTWQEKAWKQVKRIGDRKIKERIMSSVKNLESFPQCGNVKALTNHRYPYRLRVGDWRVFFTVVGGEITIITIEEVKKRDENTY